MKQILFLCLAAALIAGCVSTPEPVIRGQEMAIEAVAKVEIDVMNFIDAYNVEVKALAAEKYAKEFMLTESKLLAEYEGNPNVGEFLTRYKDYQNQFGVELEKMNAFYDQLATNAKAQLGFKFGVAKNMTLAVQAYNKAAGINPETFDQLLAASSDLATEVIDKYGASQTAKPTDPTKADWKTILRMAAKTDPTKLPVFGDPNSAWRKWQATGTPPTLSDLVSGVVANTKAAQDLFLPKPQPADVPSPATDANNVVTITPSN